MPECQFTNMIVVDPVVLHDEVLNIMIAGRDTVRQQSFGAVVCVLTQPNRQHLR